MQKSDSTIINRRDFFTTASGFFVGSALFHLSSCLSFSLPTSQKANEDFSVDESDWIEKSTLAKDLSNYFGQGYSCAESLLMVSLRYLGKPEELVWAAAGFGGGLYHKDLCGFLTGGTIAIGLASGMVNKSRREAKEYCGDLVRQYWKWWTARSPLHCSEIRTEKTNPSVCRNLGLLSAAKIEYLIKPIKN
jgi:hypothetical protein